MRRSAGLCVKFNRSVFFFRLEGHKQLLSHHAETLTSDLFEGGATGAEGDVLVDWSTF